MTERGSNRQALLDAAIRCLEETGYARTTARDLVAASGTNLGAIGYHFGSKEALLNEALAQCSRRWVQQLAENATHTSSGDAVRDAIDIAHQTASADRALAAAYIEAWTEAQHSPELRSQLANHYGEFRDMTAALVQTLTRAGSEHGTEMDDDAEADPEALSAIAVALTDGLMVQWLLDPSALPQPSRLANAVRALAEL